MQNSEKYTPNVLVIGGGIAGLTAAWELSQMGLAVTLIEKDFFIGGNAANLTCKATDRCLKCNKCLVADRIRAVCQEEPFGVHLQTVVTDIARKDGRFRVALKSDPQPIDREKCTDCGACSNAWADAVPGAVVKASSAYIHPYYAVDVSQFGPATSTRGAELEALCPEGAIHMGREGRTWDVEVDGIVIATGYQVFDPEVKKRFMYPHFGNMISGMDLEKMLRDKGCVLRPSDGAVAEKIAFVQCVGSRDPSIGHDYCSRVCCGYSLRMGLKTVHDNPEAQVTVFYMDIQNFGKDFYRYRDEAAAKLRLMRGLPGDFSALADDRIQLSYFDEPTNKTLTDDFDLVVLTVGVEPNPDNGRLASHFGLALNKDGFLAAGDGDADGRVVVAGTAEGPMNVAESVSHGKRAAAELKRQLAGEGR